MPVSAYYSQVIIALWDAIRRPMGKSARTNCTNCGDLHIQSEYLYASLQLLALRKKQGALSHYVFKGTLTDKMFNIGALEKVCGSRFESNGTRIG